MALDLKHQTAEQFAARYWQRVRDAYRAGDKLRYHFLIWWLWDKIQAGDITSNQARLSFNAAYGKALTVTQWQTFVADKLLPIKDRYLAFLATEEAS